MKTPISDTRASLMTTVFNNARWFGGLLAGTAVLGSSSVLAGTWTGAVSTDWNNSAGNWSGGNGGPAQINSIPANIATISATFTTIPTQIIVGFSTAGRVDHVAGSASVAAANDLVLGRTTGGNGTYNLANTAVGGGSLTGFGQGSGNVTIPDQVYVGGFLAAATGTLNINTSGTLSIGTQLLVGNLGGIGTVKMDSGTITVVDAIEIGNGTDALGTVSSTGTFSMSGGAVTKSSNNTAVTIGGGVTPDGGTGTANLNGGTFTTAGVFRVGQNLSAPTAPNSNGTLNLGGTNLTVNGEFWVGNNTGATGTMTFSNGSLNTNSWASIGRKDAANTGVGATGTVTMSGGTWTKTGESNLIVGDTGSGSMNMSGGLVIVNPHATPDRGITWIGYGNNCSGTLSISNTAEFRSSRFVVGVQTGTTGTLNLSGGTVKTTGITGLVGDSTVNFDGTQIIATGNSGAFIDSLTTANLNAGGLKVDSAGFNLTAPQALAGSGGVIKTGTGTLSLTGANSYTGNHTVSGGKLAVATNSNGIGNFTVANGAAMGVIQTFNASMSVSNVILGGSGAASLDIEFLNAPGIPTAAPLNVTGALTLNGPITLNVADLQPEVGNSIPLVTYSLKNGPGNFILGSLPLGVTGTLTDDGTGLVSLNISAITFPLWQGTVDGNWDTTTQNWIDQITSSPMLYQNPLPVTFDDSAPGSTALILGPTIAVSPANVTFNNSTLLYTLGGSGKITGPTGLTKSGSESLTISTANNDYTGVTTLSGGTTSVGILTNGGVASPLGAASAAETNLVLDGGTLEYTGGSVTIDRGFTISASSGISNANALALSGPIIGTGGALKKSGAGLLNLTNASVALGGAEVQGGNLALTGPGQTVSVPGDLQVGTLANTPGHLTVQDSTLTVGTGSIFASGDGSTSNVVLSGSTVYTANNTLVLATIGTAVCNFTIQDNAKLIRGANGFTSWGTSGTAVVTVKNNGTITAPGDFNVSDVGTSNGTLNVQDNATVSTTGIFFVGKNGGTTGTVNVTGGTLNSTTYITIGRRNLATGFFNISGGAVNQTDAGAGFIVGENGTGTFTISGGTLDINGGGFYLSAEAAGTSHSVAYLNGGTIIAKRVVQRDFNASNYTEFHFNGGILRAHTGASSDFMSNHDLVTVDGGGAFIDSNGQAIAISQALGGSGGLTKQGAGTLSLSGANTYSGSTTVSSGTLSLSSAYLSNTAIVTIAAGAVLNLNYAGTDQVSGLTIGTTPLAIGTYDSITHPGVITGNGKLQVTGATSPYVTWISGFPSIPLADRDPGDDPDNDGDSNAAEFALGGIPNNGGNRAKIYTLIADSNADVDATGELLMTIAVRNGTPAFTGSPSPTATQDGVTYQVQGTATLTSFTTVATPVNMVAPPAPNVTPPAGYEYRTFSLSGSNGTLGKGFLRVNVIY